MSVNDDFCHIPAKDRVIGHCEDKCRCGGEDVGYGNKHAWFCMEVYWGLSTVHAKHMCGIFYVLANVLNVIDKF